MSQNNPTPSNAFLFTFSRSLKLQENTFVREILTNDLLFDNIFDCCSPATILILSRTCKIAHGASLSYIERKYSVNRLLGRYFPDPLAFRSLQRRTGALVSGSTALQFFLREHWPESDLDVYVHKDVREEICRWVLAQGYTFKPSRYQKEDFELAIKEVKPEPLHQDDRYAWIAVDSVFTFVKPDETHPKGELQIQIIVSKGNPMEVILKFHTSAVMNVIAWDSAYALYPRATLERRAILFLRHDLRVTSDFMKKYTDRAFNIQRNLYNYDARALFCEHTVRWIGDGRAWVIPLPPVPEPELEGTATTILSRDPCIGTAWRIQGEWAPAVVFTAIRSDWLRHTYIGSGKHIYSAIKKIEKLCEEDHALKNKEASKSNGDHDMFCDEVLIQYCIRELAQKRKWRTWHSSYPGRI